MNIREFETMVKGRSMSMTERKHIDDVEVYVCDGLDGEKYTTWYAVGRDPENLDFAQRLEFAKYEDINGVLVASKKEWRVNKAFEEAKKMIPNIKRTPIYGN